MRLRISFLAAALFLSVGVAFALAAEPADEETRRETTYIVRNPAFADNYNSFSQYFFDAVGSNSLTIIFLQYNSIAETESIWNRSTAKYVKDSKKSSPDDNPSFPNDQTSDLNDKNEPAKAETEPLNANRNGDEDKLPVYDFTISFSDKVTDRIGFTGRREDNDNSLFFWEGEDKEPDNSELSDKKIYSILPFEKKAFLNNSYDTQILSGGTYVTDFNEKKKAKAVSIPIALPLTLLFFSIGISILLVEFTSAGKKE